MRTDFLLRLDWVHLLVEVLVVGHHVEICVPVMMTTFLWGKL